jgi:FAD/FMN-containing dehydrogenase
MDVTNEVIEAIRKVVGDKGCLAAGDAMEALLSDAHGHVYEDCPLVIRPSSTNEVAAVMSICAERGLRVVPQGGKTGLVRGTVPNGAIILEMGRMNAIRGTDKANRTMTVEAGCILANIQTAADELDALFPLSLGAEGSCQIGGNLSTNAGGTGVLRYGNARDLVLGLEVVLPDGRIWDGLRALRKDNTGYDLKQLFVGAEGTLGIITAAVLKLYPKPKETTTAFVALASIEGVMETFVRVNDATGSILTGFELIARGVFEMGMNNLPDYNDPFDQTHPFYALIELSSPLGGYPLDEILETILAGLLEDGTVIDAVVAQSEAQSASLWRYREGAVEGMTMEAEYYSLDISLSASDIPTFFAKANKLVEEHFPEARLAAFGHVGDGNIHYVLVGPKDMTDEEIRTRSLPCEGPIFDLISEMNGSFSAEHGVGTVKLDAMSTYKSPVELDLMRDLKKTLDPANIMNPGKVVPDA